MNLIGIHMILIPPKDDSFHEPGRALWHERAEAGGGVGDEGRTGDGPFVGGAGAGAYSAPKVSP